MRVGDLQRDFDEDLNGDLNEEIGLMLDQCIKVYKSIVYFNREQVTGSRRIRTYIGTFFVCRADPTCRFKED
jgi:hypothetical protein